MLKLQLQLHPLVKSKETSFPSLVLSLPPPRGLSDPRRLCSAAIRQEEERCEDPGARISSDIMRDPGSGDVVNHNDIVPVREHKPSPPAATKI